MPTDAADGRVLTSNATGDASWREASGRTVEAGENIIFSTRDYSAYPDSYTQQFSTKQFVNGTVRIRYNLCAPAFGTAYARIYKNGIPAGIEHSVSNICVPCVDDISVQTDDTIELWTRRNGGYVSVSDFRILVQ